MDPRGLVLAALLAFAGNGAAQAQQIACPVTSFVAVPDGSSNTDHCNIAPSGTLKIGNNVTLTNDSNNAFISVDGRILTSGLLNNTGVIIVTNPGSIVNGASGAPIAAIVNDTVDGSILNAGHITNQFGAAWTNSSGAGLGNDGIFTVVSGSTLVNTGADTRLFNAGPAALGPGVGVGATGLLDIAGSTAVNRDNALIYNKIGGTITLRDGAFFSNTGGATLTNDGTLATAPPVSALTRVTNQTGSLLSNQTGATISNMAGGQFTNTDAGSLFANGAILTNDGAGTLFTNQAGAQFTNDGIGALLQNTGQARITTTGAGTGFTNQNGATVVNSAVLGNRGTALFSNQSAGMVLNTAGGLITNSDAGSRIVNAATMTNDGAGTSILNAINAMMTNAGGQLNNQAGAALINRTGGIMVNNSGGQLMNTGAGSQVVNAATMTNDGIGTLFVNQSNALLTNTRAFSNQNSATLFNAATVVNQGAGVMTNQSQATVFNSGVILNQAQGSIVNDGVGSEIINGTQGVVTNQDPGSVFSNQNGAQLTNTGTFDNQTAGQFVNRTGASIQIGSGGQFVNAGNGTHFLNTGAQVLVTGAGSAFVNTINATLTNSGTFRVTDGAALTNQFGATIANTASMTIDTTNFQNNASLVNQGSGATFTFAKGTFVNQNGASIVNQTDATMVFDASSGSLNMFNQSGASIVNSTGGQLRFGLSIVNALFTNTGAGTLIVNAADMFQTGEFTNANGATLINTGRLINSFVLSNTTGGQLVNLVGGTIENLVLLQNSATVVNAGTIVNNSPLAAPSVMTNSGNGATFTVTAQGTVTGNGVYQQGGSGGPETSVTIVDGRLTQSRIDVFSGTLKGTGTFAAPVINIGQFGVVSPGHSPGTLTMIGAVNFLGTLDLEIASGISYDILKVFGSLTFGTGARIDLILDSALSPGDYLFDFIQVEGSLIGFDPSIISIEGGNSGLSTNWVTVCSNGVCGLELRLSQSADVPEPSTLFLLIPAALLGFAVQRRGRRGSRA